MIATSLSFIIVCDKNAASLDLLMLFSMITDQRYFVQY